MKIKLEMIQSFELTVFPTFSTDIAKFLSQHIIYFWKNWKWSQLKHSFIL